MALLNVIRRWHLRNRMPIQEIARRTRLSRNTTRKYVRSSVGEQRFRVPERSSKLDPFAEKLSHSLRIEAAKSRKQRRTVTDNDISITIDLGRSGIGVENLRFMLFDLDGNPGFTWLEQATITGSLDGADVPVMLAGGSAIFGQG